MAKFQTVAQLLHERLRRGEYQTGKLPGLRGLAADMGVSYLTARRAVKFLEEQGLVNCDHNGRLQLPEPSTNFRVAMITPFWTFSDWHREIRAAVNALGGQLRFITYGSDSDPVITETLNSNYELFLIQLPATRNPRLLDLLQQRRDRVLILFEDLSQTGLASLFGCHVEHLTSLLETVQNGGAKTIDFVAVHAGESRDIRLRREIWQNFLNTHQQNGQFRFWQLAPYESAAQRSVLPFKTLLNSKERPDAIFCMFYEIAIGLYRAAYELGLEIGRDLSVLTFGHVAECSLMTPDLATVGECWSPNPLRPILEEIVRNGSVIPGHHYRVEAFIIAPGKSIVQHQKES